MTFRFVRKSVGGRWSRFASFLYSPASVIAYLRGKSHPDHLVGHNPLGAGSVFAMLLVLPSKDKGLAAVYFPLALLLYTPVSYYTDLFFYRRRQAKALEKGGH